MILSQKFYARHTAQVARDLLGQILVHETPQGTASGRIIEVEAYLPKNDPGCHAARGKTPRNEVLFGPPGQAYVYFCYGAHFLFNVVTEKDGTAGAVLIRALEPVEGMGLMGQRRRHPSGFGLTNGPGKLVQALGIGGEHNRAPIWRKPLYIRKAERQEAIGVTTRVGLSEGAELPLRFFLRGNPYLSVKPGAERPSENRKRTAKGSR
jgi:DNA-3-methyladenine glycosylase